MVRQIRGATKPKSVNFRLTMDQYNRFKLRSKKLKRSTHWPEFHLWQSAEFVLRIKNVAKHAADERSRIGRGIQRKPVGLGQKPQRTKIVNPKNMIGMRVCKKPCIQMAIFSPDPLLPKTRRGVYQPPPPAILNQHRGPG